MMRFFDYIATHIKSNIRDLEGDLKQESNVILN